MRCSYALCKTGLPGIVTPVATFLPVSAPKYMPRGHAVMKDLRLCESCCLTAKVHEMVDDKRWADITTQIIAQGGALPDRDSLKLMFAYPKDQALPPTLEASLRKARAEA